MPMALPSIFMVLLLVVVFRPPWTLGRIGFPLAARGPGAPACGELGFPWDPPGAHGGRGSWSLWSSPQSSRSQDGLSLLH